MYECTPSRSAQVWDVFRNPLPGSLKGDVPASKDLPGKKSYLTMKAVERYVAESSCINFF